MRESPVASCVLDDVLFNSFGGIRFLRDSKKKEKFDDDGHNNVDISTNIILMTTYEAST